MTRPPRILRTAIIIAASAVLWGLILWTLASVARAGR